MAKAEEQSEHAEAYRLINKEADTTLEFDEWQQAQERMSEAVEDFPELSPEDFKIEPITESTSDADETQQDSDAPAVVDKTEFDPEDADHAAEQESTHDQHSAIEKDTITEPERSVTDDPIAWLNRNANEFVDTIQGTQAINKKGFLVLQHFYDIDVTSEVVVAPEETNFEYCRVKARAEMPDGRIAEAHGSAHVDREDDHYLLLEMADTRAKSRALSDITGVGAVAVAELKNDENHA